LDYTRPSRDAYFQFPRSPGIHQAQRRQVQFVDEDIDHASWIILDHIIVQDAVASSLQKPLLRVIATAEKNNRVNQAKGRY
jgi:hypothetical protein